MSTGPSTGTSGDATRADPTADTTADVTDGDGDGLPNINMLSVADRIASSTLVGTAAYEADGCAVAEGCVDAPGLRRVLRFQTVTPNDGDADLVVGRPEDNPDAFEYGECHEHFHFKDFAVYRLLDTNGKVVRNGHKQAFALIDFEALGLDSPPPRYPLPDGTQGITRGWADVYDAYLDCQWVDVTDVEPGNYVLEIEINPEQVFEESTYDDNIVEIPVSITAEDDRPPTLPPGWTCPAEAWHGHDGCDCGCGSVDPDCLNPTVKACDNCEAEGSCSADAECSNVSAGNNATCE
ncbi:MAG: lysyl oxidase family protein [Myxococcota bacterium]